MQNNNNFACIGFSILRYSELSIKVSSEQFQNISQHWKSLFIPLAVDDFLCKTSNNLQGIEISVYDHVCDLFMTCISDISGVRKIESTSNKNSQVLNLQTQNRIFQNLWHIILIHTVKMKVLLFTKHVNDDYKRELQTF